MDMIGPDGPMGVFEQLITQACRQRLAKLSPESIYIGTENLNPEEAALFLSRHVQRLVQRALGDMRGQARLQQQIDLVNRVLDLLRDDQLITEGDLVAAEGKILTALFPRAGRELAKFDDMVRHITPASRFSQSALFSGQNGGISLDSEIRREIRSADEIWWLVSFIRWTGLRLFQDDLMAFAQAGKPIRLLTSTYMGASEVRAIDWIARELPTAQVKVSYDQAHERLHAKAYIFKRQSGFHTAYVGSSNLSRAAQTQGLEWNVKISQVETPDLMRQCLGTFISYWENPAFESYQPEDREKLTLALSAPSKHGDNPTMPRFDLRPFPFQEEILERLETAREVHGRYRNLIVAATGTGKTMISAFDYRRLCLGKRPRPRLLFVAHRKEILEQALATFRGVLGDASFGELWVGESQATQYDYLFLSIQTFTAQKAFFLGRTPGHYDLIIIDEVHHLAASSYRPLVQHFQPKILLGLTATPERMDGGDILEDFDGHIAAEIRLPEAITRGLLCPFQYFGVPDGMDLSKVSRSRGKYEVADLERRYLAAEARLTHIFNNLRKYLPDPGTVRALGFCVSQRHARYMAEAFQRAGLRAAALTAEDRAEQRRQLRAQLQAGTLNYLFVVDLFNEGVDIPEVDTVLFLRPTESLTVFLQQLGRGLRLHAEKTYLTILDFVGQQQQEYDYDHKFRALVGRTHTSVASEIAAGFPHVPPGCAIYLEPKVQTEILAHINRASRSQRQHLLRLLRRYPQETSRPLSLGHFLDFYHLDIRSLYKGNEDSWLRLQQEAGLKPTVLPGAYSLQVSRAIGTRWLQTQCSEYLRFIQQWAQTGHWDPNSLRQQRLALMLHYDLWQASGPKAGLASLPESLAKVQQDPGSMQELQEVLEVQLESLAKTDQALPNLPDCPIRLHGRYTRDQILAAFGLHTFDQASYNREGVAVVPEQNIELLFVTLQKSEAHYSPSTLYEDYAISPTLFHWQSQNSAAPHTPKGQSYIQHADQGKRILLFVRERQKDEFKQTMGYVCLGDVAYRDHSGEKPMSITWEMEEPLPAFLWRESAKLQVG